MKLLIADDNEVNLRLLRAQLEVEGHEVVWASNGVEGLQMLRGERVDGAISDILMHEMDGYRFCLEVRKDPALRGLPFVLYTSTYNSPADRELAVKVGADAYITKPAPVRTILDALHQAAGKGGDRILPELVRNGDIDVLKQYNEALVRKLEERNLALEQSLQRLELIHEIDLAIIAAKAPAEIAAAALPRLRDLMGLPRVVVNLIDVAKNEAEWLAAVGRRRTHVGPGVRFPAAFLGDLQGLKRGELQLIDVASLEKRTETEALLASDVRWYMVIPMIAGGELIGGLSFGGPSRAFPVEQLAIAREAAAQLAIAIAQSRLGDRANRADALNRLVFSNVPVGITVTGADGVVISANEQIVRMLGYGALDEAMAAIGGRARSVYADPAEREKYVSALQKAGTVRGMELQLVRRDGSRFWASLDGSVAPIEPGGAPVLITIIDDITGQREQAHRIERLSRVKEMQSAINSAVVRIRDRQTLLNEVCRIAVEKGGLRAAWIGWHDAECRRIEPIATAGPFEGFLELVGLSTDGPSEALDSPAARVLLSGKPEVANDLGASAVHAFGGKAVERGFLSMMHLPLVVAGAPLGVLVLYAPETGFFDAEETALLGELAADVSFALESLHKTERLDYLAYYDPVTGLPNRALYRDRLAHSLRSRGGDARLVAVALLDLERFRQVNESLGRDKGDALLREVGRRLRAASESAARLGADVFGLKLRGARNAAEASRALEAILRACFTEPIAVDGHELRVACRAGVSIHPDDGADADGLLRNAEAALRRSKGTGEHIVFYAPEMNARVAEALAIENRLRHAIERRQFVLHYQPKVALADGRITGVEALIRWRDPDAGLVPPGHFIPVLEETGLIVEVGRWAVEQAFKDLNGWAAVGVPVPRVAVNLSAIQLQRKDFVDGVIDEISRGGDNPEWLELEITESLVMHNVEDSTRKLSVLRGMGVTVAIDDFGTGYSSLSYLGRLPVDSLKIDRSFISGVSEESDSVTVVSTIIALAHGLHLNVVAEGVETKDQAELLRLLRCDEAQGYLYSKPVPADEIAVLLRAGALGRK